MRVSHSSYQDHQYGHIFSLSKILFSALKHAGKLDRRSNQYIHVIVRNELVKFPLERVKDKITAKTSLKRYGENVSLKMAKITTS